ncbi:MAG: TonB-dependent receptor [Paludibacteraceae bacterium]
MIRPGISYQSAIYDDSQYLTDEELSNLSGFLNGAPKITNFAGYIRGDYSLKEKLRLIAALRADKYNVPNSTYFTYQFISTYNFNQKNLLRLVYSRANRGPFIVDSYANYNWQVVPTNSNGMTPQLLIWNGNKNLDLPVMDMFEIGFRTQPIKNIMFDIEAFRSVTKNFSYFMPDTMNVTLNLATGKATNSVAHIQYYNFDLQSTQIGLTFNISAVLTKNLNFKVFGTFQKTDLENVYPKNYFNNLADMQASIPGNPQLQQDGYLLTVAMRAQAAQAKIVAGVTPTTEELQAAQLYQTFTVQQMGRIGQLASQGYSETYQVYNTDIENGKVRSDLLEKSSNKATPSFYGGVSLSYSPMPKLNTFLSSYFFTSNEIIHSETDDTNTKGFDPIYKVDGKAIFSLKVSYKIYKENSIFINCRNLFNSSSREFGFMDKVYGKYLVGANISF